MAKSTIVASAFFADRQQVQGLARWILCNNDPVACNTRRQLNVGLTRAPSESMLRKVIGYLFDEATDNLALAEAYVKNQA